MSQFLVYRYLYLVVLISICEGENKNANDPQSSNTASHLQEWKEEIHEVRSYLPRTLFLLDPSKDLTEMKPVEGCTVTTPSNEDQEKLVNFHNSIRRRVAKGLEDRGYNGSTLPKAKNMIAMGYSDIIEKMATKWASRCNRYFEDHYTTDDYNHIWQSMVHNSGDRPTPQFDFLQSAEHRYNTSVGLFYGPDAVKPFSGRNSQTGEDIRSYAIMVHHGLRSLGCAQATYFNATEQKHHRFAICNYAGSFKSDTPLYSEGEPCSDVSPYYCDNGLTIVKDSDNPKS